MSNEIEIAELMDIFQVDEFKARLAVDLMRAEMPRRVIEELFFTLPNTGRWISSCYNRPSQHEQLMHALNEILGSHGVEAILDGTQAVLEYLNSGDTYDQTLCFVDGEFKLSSYGDELEAMERDRNETYEGNGVWISNEEVASHD